MYDLETNRAEPIHSTPQSSLAIVGACSRLAAADATPPDTAELLPAETVPAVGTARMRTAWMRHPKRPLSRRVRSRQSASRD